MRSSLERWGAFAAGPLAAGIVLALGVGMPGSASRVAALAAWMAVWWLTAVVPLAATAPLPLALLPLIGVGRIEAVAASYADPIIFLFMGGFFLAAASERWGLHRRLALGVIGVVGSESRRVILAVMLATGFVSMWISNTATAAMMLPITVALTELARREAPASAAAFGTALVLGMAYAASIGGVATLIGTPPTAIFAAALQQLGDPKPERVLVIGVAYKANIVWHKVRKDGGPDGRGVGSVGTGNRPCTIAGRGSAEGASASAIASVALPITTTPTEPARAPTQRTAT